MTSEARVITVGSALVAVGTGALPFVRGWGTILFQLVVLNAWGIVAGATSASFADRHHEVVWPVALLLNLTAYAAPLALLRFSLKRARTSFRVGTILLWTAFYLASPFMLFPATDGP